MNDEPREHLLEGEPLQAMPEPAPETVPGPEPEHQDGPLPLHQEPESPLVRQEEPQAVPEAPEAEPEPEPGPALPQLTKLQRGEKWVLVVVRHPNGIEDGKGGVAMPGRTLKVSAATATQHAMSGAVDIVPD
jgi:hypothetical protein